MGSLSLSQIGRSLLGLCPEAAMTGTPGPVSHGAARAVMDAARLGSRDCGPLSPQPGSAAAAW
jgi:hypothetical protein